MTLQLKKIVVIAAFMLAGCGNALEDEAKRLGFSSVSEMEDIHRKGWHTNAQYRADESERAKRLGFVDMDELHDAESDGIMDPVAFRKHRADEEARDAKSDENVVEPQQNNVQASVAAVASSSTIITRLGTYGHDDCKTGNNRGRTCVSESDWKALCENATGLSTAAKVNAAGDIGLTNIPAEDIEIFWDESKSRKCRYTFAISRNVNGYVTRSRHEGAASEIYVYKDRASGEIMRPVSDSDGWGATND